MRPAKPPDKRPYSAGWGSCRVVRRCTSSLDNSRSITRVRDCQRDALRLGIGQRTEITRPARIAARAGTVAARAQFGLGTARAARHQTEATVLAGEYSSKALVSR